MTGCWHAGVELRTPPRISVSSYEEEQTDGFDRTRLAHGSHSPGTADIRRRLPDGPRLQIRGDGRHGRLHRGGRLSVSAFPGMGRGDLRTLAGDLLPDRRLLHGSGAA